MMMKAFLEQVANCLHNTYGDELQRYCIVFPNIRAGLFFKRYLAQLSDKPVWAPEFRSLNSLFEEITGWTQADRLSLIFELFKAFKQHKQTNESFENFYFWGEMLLEDFDDADKHLVDARDLFRNVADLKEIDRVFDYLSEQQKEAIRLFWQDFNGGNKGSFKDDFETVWTLLFPIYETFRNSLKEKSVAYEGMIQREAAHLMREGIATHIHYEKYVFIGFNALTKCEARFFDSLKKLNKAIFFWDYDQYYLCNQWHEAGAFMRENIQRFPSEWNFDTRNLEHPSKRIEIISVPSDTGQTMLAGQLLENIYAQDGENIDWIRTVVVLTDEYLLLPMLSALPEAARDVNITMGYPFTCSPANSLFERLASLQQHSRLYADGARFFHQDVCMILQHPYIQSIIPNEAAAIIKYIIEHNRIYVAASTPAAITREGEENRLLQDIFKRCTHAKEFTDYLLTIISIMMDDAPALSSNEDGGRGLYLYTLQTALQRIRDVLATDNIDMEIQVFCRLLRKVLASLKIPFSGEPLRGLQLMGMLETRSLDFDHVIILSMNEGIFPKGSPHQSFIPYNLRKGFGLTTSERNDAVNAYHFYRLIQRATNVHLICNSAATDLNAGEMSRFISQLIYEPVFKVQRRNFTFNINIGSEIPIVKERTDEVRQILGMYLAENSESLSQPNQTKRLSPSALNCYIDCPLRFYFRYVEGLKEKDEVTDEIDHSVFGKLLHKTMELMYQPLLKTEITPDILARLQKDQKNIQKNMLRAFAEEYFHAKQITDADITGRNIIIREVLLKYIRRILEIDGNTAPFTILSLEEPLRVRLPIRKDGQISFLNMYGYIDRLDCVRDTLRIIDYKTGNAQCSFKSIADLFDSSKTGNHAVMQTLTYSCMTRMVHDKYSRICSGLYVMKDLFKEEFDPRIHISRQPPIDNYFDVADEFETELNRLLSEMFLSEEPFTQTENRKKCANCLYKDFCN